MAKKLSNREIIDNAHQTVAHNYLLSGVINKLHFYDYFAEKSIIKADAVMKDEQIAILYENGYVFFNSKLKFSEENWEFIFAIITLHYCFNLVQKPTTHKKIYLDEISKLLFCVDFVKNLKIGEPIANFDVLSDLSGIKIKNEDSFYSYASINGIPDKFKKCTFSQGDALSLIYHPIFLNAWDEKNYRQTNYQDIFADSLMNNAKKTLQLKSNTFRSEDELKKLNTKPYKARSWFISHYPLLGALAASFEIIEDIKVCQSMGISIAAVSPSLKEIYINPLANLNFENMKFVMAHEMLHVGLAHQQRCEGRDPYLWNVACDFVINDWLIELNIGIAPEGVLFEETLKGLSAEEIYYKIEKDLKLQKKLGTLAGHKKGDMIGPSDSGKYLTDLDEFYKRALATGLELHESCGRGFLPGGLVEEIKRINQPPIPWQVKLADWIREHFPLAQKRRSYARPSRRQSTTPDIPRPSYVKPYDEKNTKVFGVILDSSGSMDRELLGKGIGAITSYAIAQEIKYIRLICCDTQPYDAGFVPVLQLLNRVKIAGRGGTILQSGIQYLENRDDFPSDAPILIITDGYCEEDLKIKRDHAYLIPKGHRLPFSTKKPIFYME
jgi:predicted metal-dependent peptidase